jgi:uncharacterized protein YyaL (SSP411 family)
VTSRPANRLAHSSSPYLLEHAHNPVDWFPWGDEALAKAKADDKPIFLSVGYAACHWCHVMERESFEDEETAALLNQHFVSVKVDREERPDIDAIYMEAVQAMSGGHGGWPMSVFLTPIGEPFFAGTYFPKEARYGAPAFRQVLLAIAGAWRERRGDVLAQGARLRKAIDTTASLAAGEEQLDGRLTAAALDAIARSFDRRWGGIGGAPKFPQPMTFEFVLRMAARGSADALAMVRQTLDRMADGGIRDQLGGGFSRYSTDAAWHVPHFEKMLYDNAQLSQLYTRAWLITRDDRYRTIATGILDELTREMQHVEGGFFSSVDADSEGEEGKFYTWTWEELVSTVGEPIARAFGASPEGNWDPDGSGHATNVLWHPVSIGEVAREAGIDSAVLARDVAAAARALFQLRASRERPAVDDKIVTGWNALAIRAFAEAGRSFGERRYLDIAERCGHFVWEHLRDGRGRLLRSWREGTTSVPGFADDHALLVLGLLALYEATGDVEWFSRARETGDRLIDLFHDGQRGGFFQTGADADALIVRPKELYDNAVPSGNSAAAEALLRLAMFSGDARYESAAVGALQLVAQVMRHAPAAVGHALCATDLLIGPRKEIVIVGSQNDVRTRALLAEVFTERYLPNAVVAQTDPDAMETGAAVPLTAGRTADAPSAFVCERFACNLPATTAKELVKQLKQA